MTAVESPADLARSYSAIAQELAGHREVDTALRALVELARQRVPGAEYAGITQALNGSLKTVAATDEVVERVDRIQYKLRCGPSLDALAVEPVIRSADLAGDDRWPKFGERAAEATIRAMLSYRLFVEQQDVKHGASAVLNLYATTAGAFDEHAETTGLLLAGHGALAVLGAAARQRADNLEHALKTNRDIGVAMGVLMLLHKITRQQAFDVLCMYSQQTNRKLADVAAEIADTGQLPDLPHGEPPARPAAD